MCCWNLGMLHYDVGFQLWYLADFVCTHKWHTTPKREREANSSISSPFLCYLTVPAKRWLAYAQYSDSTQRVLEYMHSAYHRLSLALNAELSFHGLNNSYSEQQMHNVFAKCSTPNLSILDMDTICIAESTV